MANINLYNSNSLESEGTKLIRTKCIESTIRFLGRDQPFEKLQLFFSRMLLLFLTYTKAMELTDKVNMEDFQIDPVDITAWPVIEYIRDLPLDSIRYMDPIRMLSVSYELDARHQLALAYCLGITSTQTHQEFNNLYGVDDNFLKRYCRDTILHAMTQTSAQDNIPDQQKVVRAKTVHSRVLGYGNGSLIKYQDESLVSSESSYYEICRLVSENKSVNISLLTERQLSIWNYVENFFYETDHFPTYIQICEALNISDELFWDNTRSISDKLNGTGLYRKSTNGLIKPLQPDSPLGRVIEAANKYPEQLEECVLTDLERQVLNLAVVPIENNLYRTIRDISTEVGITNETTNRIFERILRKLGADKESLYITKEGETLPETNLRVRLCKMIEDPSFLSIFNDQNIQFIRLLTARNRGVFIYSNREIAELMGFSSEDRLTESSSDSSHRVNRKLAAIFERLEEVEAVDSNKIKIRGNRLELIKLSSKLQKGALRILTDHERNIFELATKEVSENTFYSMSQIASMRNISEDSARMAVSHILKKLKKPRES